MQDLTLADQKPSSDGECDADVGQEDKEAPIEAAVTASPRQTACSIQQQDMCEVCFEGPRAARALVPCDHARF